MSDIEIPSSGDGSLIEFPCDFTLKIIGKDTDQFKTTIIDIIQKHYPDFTTDRLTTRPSKEGGYIALSATVYAHSKAELDALYIDISSTPDVIMTL